MTLQKYLERLREIDANSGGDCKCHYMMTCPDKAQDYWAHWDEHVPKLLKINEVLVGVLEYVGQCEGVVACETARAAPSNAKRLWGRNSGNNT